MTNPIPPRYGPSVFPNDVERALVDAVREATNDEEANPTRGFAAGAATWMLNVFKNRYNVDKQTGGRVCLQRLHGKQCQHVDSREEGHAIPHRDHRSLWLRDGDPAIVVNHLYPITWEDVQEIVEFCSSHDLEATFDSFSWYSPMSTTMVVIRSGL